MADKLVGLISFDYTHLYYNAFTSFQQMSTMKSQGGKKKYSICNTAFSYYV